MKTRPVRRSAPDNGVVRKEVLAEGVELYLADTARLLPTVGLFDACVTDPPYGLNMVAGPIRETKEKCEWDNATPPAEIFAKIFEISKHQIIWGGNYFDLPPSQGYLIWDKLQPEAFSFAMCEMAWISMQRPAKIFRHSALAFVKEHPTQKPPKLMIWCLDQLPEDVHTVIDPYMGSGSTGVAAVVRGKAFCGIERDPAYFDIACKRISDALNTPDLVVDRPVRLRKIRDAYAQSNLFRSLTVQEQ